MWTYFKLILWALYSITVFFGKLMTLVIVSLTHTATSFESNQINYQSPPYPHSDGRVIGCSVPQRDDVLITSD